MEPLEPPDSHYLSAAIGWIGLGDLKEAGVELDKIAPQWARHPDVLLVRYQLASEADDWTGADEMARDLIDLHPQESQFWIWHAYARRRMPGGGIPQAREILDRAQRLFPAEPLIRYNLGCYECQLGNLQSAWKWLEKAFELGNLKMVKAMALKDQDLAPLWEKIGSYRQPPLVPPPEIE